MRIDCTVDGKTLNISINSNKPLSLILQENLDNQSTTAHCKGRMCGLCAVLVEGKAELSCMIPAFELKNKHITTFDQFQKSKEMKDIVKAYESLGVEPCKDCYASRSIIFESLISSGEKDEEEIKRTLSAVRCSCMNGEDEVNIVKKAQDIRKKRNLRRS